VGLQVHQSSVLCLAFLQNVIFIEQLLQGDILQTNKAVLGPGVVEVATELGCSKLASWIMHTA